MLLHSIRERATGWFAWVIVILISIPFALWGINSYITPDVNPAVANVGEYKITVQEFQNSVQNESQNLKGQIDNSLLKQLVLEKLINNRAMINYLVASGQSISKEQIDKQVRFDETFQVDGKFSQDLYNRYLPSAYSKSNYRNSLATSLLLQQFSTGIESSAIVSDQEVKRVIQLLKQKREIKYSLIKKEDFIDLVSVSDEEIKNYYENFQQQFENPEQVKLAYLDLSRKDLAQSMEVNEEQINKYYQDNLTQYTQPERRHASHILFTLETDVDDTAKDKIKAEAQEVLNKINTGADFSEMAKQHSKDPGSAEKGGDLGFFGPGEMVPTFEEAAFSLSPGEISELVESPFGFHIIKLIAIEGGQAKPLEEVKGKIIEDIQFEQAENSYFEKTEAMQTLAYEQPDSLEPIASELNMSIKESPLMSKRGGEDIFSNNKLLGAAFSESVLEEGNNSDLIDLGNDHVIVFRIIERIPANIKPLDEVRNMIETRLKSDSVTKKAQEKADALIKQLQEGVALADVVKSNSLIMINTGLVERQDISVPAAVLQKAFTMPREMKFSSTVNASGDIALVVINSIEDGDSGDAALFNNIKMAMIQNKGNIETALSVLQIRSESKITINAELLKEEE